MLKLKCSNIRWIIELINIPVDYLLLVLARFYVYPGTSRYRETFDKSNKTIPLVPPALKQSIIIFKEQEKL